MDSAERQFLDIERGNIQRALELLSEARARPKISRLEWIAIATLLQNLYNGVENVLRFVLQNRGVKVQHSGSWHKDLLAAARNNGLITDETAAGLLRLLLFRHVHIHGYSHSLDPASIEPLASNAPALVERFLAEMESLELGSGRKD